MPRMTVDPTYCKGCGLCIASCPKKIIRFSENINARGHHYAECFEQDKHRPQDVPCILPRCGHNGWKQRNGDIDERNEAVASAFLAVADCISPSHHQSN